MTTPTSPNLPEPATCEDCLTVVAYLRATKDGVPIWGENCVCQNPVYPSDPDGSDAGSISMPLVRLSDAQLLAAEVEQLRAEVAAKDAENERLSHQWCEIRQDREMVADAVRRLLQAPGDPNVASMGRLAIGEPTNG